MKINIGPGWLILIIGGSTIAWGMTGFVVSIASIVLFIFLMLTIISLVRGKK